MQEAVPFKSSWLPIQPLNPSSGVTKDEANDDDLNALVTENAVIVFARRGCCMSLVVKLLLQGLGVNPALFELHDHHHENQVLKHLHNLPSSADAHQPQFPAVFIGGRFFGGLDRLMATHITGELTPLLKQAGALWL